MQEKSTKLPSLMLAGHLQCWFLLGRDLRSMFVTAGEKD
jgi:hypothetical protein